MDDQAYARLETVCNRGVGLRPARDDDMIEVKRGDLRLLLASPTDMKLVDSLKSIAEMTDPDSPEENYRADDREGCLDTVFSVASQAIAGVNPIQG